MWTQARKDAHTSSRAERILFASLVILSLAGVGIVLLSTSRYGVGFSPDSSGYISAARNLLAGAGLRCYDGSPYTYWPPLFPVCLAAIGLAGIDPAVGARFLNAFALGGITFLAGMLLRRCLWSKCLVVLGTAAVLLCSLRLGVAGMAWTEPVFVLLITAFAFYLPVFLARPGFGTVAVASVLAALCSMQRYTGVALIVAGAILIILFLPNVARRRRVQFLALFLTISCTPLALWALRNYALTSAFSGMDRMPSIYSPAENATYALGTITKWFVPETISLVLRTGIVGLFILLSGVALVFSCRRWAGKARRDCSYVWPLVVVSLTYAPLILYTHQLGVLDEPMNDRYLAPLSVLMICLLFIGLDRAACLLRQIRSGGRVLSGVVIVALAVWLVHPAVGVRGRLRQQMRDGAGGYVVTSWQVSPVVNWLREHRLEGNIFSNAPEAMYALADISAGMIPWRSHGLPLFRERLSSGPNKYLIWFTGVKRSYMYDLDEMISMFCMERIATLPDGAVFRLWSPNERAFPAGPIFSPCVVNGKWSRSFSSDNFGARGVITSWIMKADGTTDSTWVLDTGSGIVLRWQASCPFAHAGDEFEFRGEGRATQDGAEAASACTFTVGGAIDGNTATGTYQVEFANPLWPSDRGTWRVELARPIYRFYHPTEGRHLYLEASEIEAGLTPLGPRPRKPVPTRPAKEWINEGIAWYACREDERPFDALPVYQFRSPAGGDVLYTVSEREKKKLLDDPAHHWTYEGIARYALAPDP